MFICSLYCQQGGNSGGNSISSQGGDSKGTLNSFSMTVAIHANLAESAETKILKYTKFLILSALMRNSEYEIQNFEVSRRPFWIARVT